MNTKKLLSRPLERPGRDDNGTPVFCLEGLFMHYILLFFYSYATVKYRCVTLCAILEAGIFTRTQFAHLWRYIVNHYSSQPSPALPPGGWQIITIVTTPPPSEWRPDNRILVHGRVEFSCSERHFFCFQMGKNWSFEKNVSKNAQQNLVRILRNHQLTKETLFWKFQILPFPHVNIC